jgi:SAM-dependent methyltransferase
MERNAQETESLGLGLKPGDPHYRAYVGPPQDYDLIAAMTFNLLTTIGLRQHHTLLDVGCGSLRVGRLLIPYLNKDRYTGIEPNEWLVAEGIKRELGADLVDIKRPRFFYSDSPTILSQMNMSFDFALAQSIFSHCGLDLIANWLGDLAKVLRPDGALLATFLLGDEDGKESGWIYPQCVSYRRTSLDQLARNVGLRLEILDWKHPRQTWGLFAKSEFDTSWFDSKPLSWNTRMELNLKVKQPAKLAD